ncbi:hypothetical protein CPT_Madawaska_168 [Staphylococcus phage Madawaska]|nr:hypothetical protein CPT_Madawaska_168 [Staphylococcus phage Madawaska]
MSWLPLSIFIFIGILLILSTNETKRMVRTEKLKEEKDYLKRQRFNNLRNSQRKRGKSRC